MGAEAGQPADRLPHDGLASVAARLVREPIDPDALAAEVAHDGVGAFATFVGVVRAEKNAAGQALLALDYTAHEKMALSEMHRIGSEVADRFPIHAARIVHRLGTLRIGEASIAIIVASPHRAAAFDACREMIERIKADVPIFKRELWSGGEATWVNPVDAEQPLT